MRNPDTVAVVIPYYQREAGILRRALDSIAAQDIDEGVRLAVIVVDDGSPCTAEAETTDFRPPPHMTIRIHRQANGGPAAARNAGLDLVPPGAAWVAFLDSDDEWQPNHLGKALAALKHDGADLYFCDHRRVGFHRSWFAEIPYPLAGSPVIRREVLRPLTLRYMPSHLSTMVFRKAAGGALRFDASLRGAGEDLIYIVRLISAVERISVSGDINVVCGQGLNIYYGHLDWDAPENLQRMAEKLWSFTLLTQALKSQQPSAEETEIVAQATKGLQNDFAFRWLRKAIREFRFPGEILYLLRKDVTALLWFPRALLSVTSRRALGTYKPLSGI